MIRGGSKEKMLDLLKTNSFVVLMVLVGGLKYLLILVPWPRNSFNTSIIYMSMDNILIYKIFWNYRLKGAKLKEVPPTPVLLSMRVILQTTSSWKPVTLVTQASWFWDLPPAVWSKLQDLHLNNTTSTALTKWVTILRCQLKLNRSTTQCKRTTSSWWPLMASGTTCL